MIRSVHLSPRRGQLHGLEKMEGTIAPKLGEKPLDGADGYYTTSPMASLVAVFNTAFFTPEPGQK